MWQLNEREYHYAACDLLGKYVAMCSASFLVDHIEPLVLSKSWWDSVDSLRSVAVTPLVNRHIELVDVMQRWTRSDNRWLIRLSIIHQLGRGNDTDTALLFELCARHQSNNEFFIAKAIGWALRDLSWTQPDLVAAFIEGHRGLTPLARREGSRRIAQVRAKRQLTNEQT